MTWPGMLRQANLPGLFEYAPVGKDRENEEKKMFVAVCSAFGDVSGCERMLVRRYFGDLSNRFDGRGEL